MDRVEDSLAYYAALKRAGGPCGDAFIRAGRACIRAATRGAFGDGMASVDGDLARDDRNDFGIGALGSQMINPVFESLGNIFVPGSIVTFRIPVIIKMKACLSSLRAL